MVSLAHADDAADKRRRMQGMLDQLDRQEVAVQLAKGLECIASGDFACARASLDAAAKAAAGEDERKMVDAARKTLSARQADTSRIGDLQSRANRAEASARSAQSSIDSANRRAQALQWRVVFSTSWTAGSDPMRSHQVECGDGREISIYQYHYSRGNNDWFSYSNGRQQHRSLQEAAVAACGG